MEAAPAPESLDLTVVVPVYNEEASLPTVLPRLLAYCGERGWCVVMVNDGSRDGTRRILAGYATHPVLTVVHHKVNRGYGGALKTGIANRRLKPTLGTTRNSGGQPPKRAMPGTSGHLSRASNSPSSSESGK